MQLRTPQSFKDAITDARAMFGTDGNNTSSISRRALRAYSQGKFEAISTHDKPVGNPVSIKCETSLDNKQFVAVVIGYVRWQIEKTMSRIQKPLELDNCENYVIEEV